MKHFSALSLAFFCLSLFGALKAQTDPTPQLLPYSENFDNTVAPTYPVGWMGWAQAVQSGAFQTAAPTGDRVLTVGNAASTGNNVYDFSQKIGFLNSGSSNNGLATALVTSGLANITISYDAMTIRDPNQRINVLGLQYRIGNAGNFTDIPGSQYHNNLTPQTTGNAGVNIQNRTVVLPPVCNNQAFVQLRFISKDSSGSGSRPSFAIDNFQASGIINAGEPVGISLSVDTAFESAQTQVTITATTANPVSNPETIGLNLSGAGVTAGDASWVPSITIAAGQTSGSTVLTISDDDFNEGTETMVVGIATLSPGLALGSPTSDTLIVVDNDFQIHLNVLNQPFGIEHFDSLSNAGNANSRFPRGIYIHELGSAADNLYGAQNGSSFSGNTYSFGATGSTERSLGGLTTGSVSTIYVGARFQNNTGQPINALKVSYTGEQWRCGGNGLGDTLFFQVSTNADSLHTGTWTSFPALNFGSPYVDTVAVALDGNQAPNFTFVSDTAANLGIIQPGQTVWIRWRDLNVAGSDDALGIDNMSVEPLVVGCLPATATDLVLLSSSGTNSISSLSTGSITTSTDGAQIMEFHLRDGGINGDFDNLPTQLLKAGFSKGNGHTAGDFDLVFAAAALFSGNTKLADGVVSSDSLVFDLLNVAANDDDSLALSLRVSLLSNGQILDQSQIHISFNTNNMLLGNLCSSSQWAGASSGSSDPAANLIDVVATQLVFSNIGQPLAINTDFSATVCAEDVHGNADKDPRNVSFSKAQGTGTLSSLSGLGPIASVNACVSRSDLRYDVAESMVLRASDNLGLTADTTLVFPMQSIQNQAGTAPRLYPNPAAKGTQVQLSQPMGDWTLYDLTGRALFCGSGLQIETNTLRPGLYLIANKQGQSLRLSVY